MKKTPFILKFVLVCFLTGLIYACAVNPVTGKRQLMLMSESQEIALGLSYDPQVISTFGLYPDDKLQTFVQARGTEMGKISHRPGLEYHVKVVDSPVVNAFAIPGGYIYLTRGILAQFNNEAELMGVLGHEMGHITARHSVSQQSKQQLGQLLLIGGMIASEKFASYAQYALQGMELLYLKFSRDDERMADRLGVRYSSMLGYDAHKMADFFQVLQKMSMSESEGGVPTFLSTHPDPGDRYNSVNANATHWQDSLQLPSWKVNTESYLTLIDGIVYGEDPRQGYVENNVFYHPEMKFMFSVPAGWTLENAPTQVTIAPSDGKALMIFTTATGASLQAAADTALAKYSLTPDKSEKVTINGLPAIVTSSKQVKQDQSAGTTTTTAVLSYFIDYNNSYFVFHSVSSESDFATYAGTMEASMKSFAKLTDNTKINVKPERIQIKKVQRSGTLAEAFKYYGVKESRMSELALLNDKELTGRVEAGTLIKIIGK